MAGFKGSFFKLFVPLVLVVVDAGLAEASRVLVDLSTAGCPTEREEGHY